MASPSIAVVIPTLDEERALEALLPSLVHSADEVVVADGGSRDATVALARQHGAAVVTSDRGRGPQLNAGAACSRSDGLLFLHADTRLPASALDGVRAALAAGYSGGGFLVRFDNPGALYAFGAAVVNLRTRSTRVPLGDQAQFADRRAFRSVGGFPDWPILEDLEFIRRLRRCGRLAVLGPPVVTSARRFERNGAARTVALNWLIFALFFFGVSPNSLRRFYPPHLTATPER